MMDRDRDAEPTTSAAGTIAPSVALPPMTIGEAKARVIRFRFYAGDDCVFADDEYLIQVAERAPKSSRFGA